MSIRTPYLIAFALTAGVAGWMLSGDIIQGGDSDARPETITTRNESTAKKLFRVKAEEFRSAERTSVIEVRGSTEAAQNVAVRSETTAILNKRHVSKGAFVEAGDLICSLNVGSREATVVQRKAELERAKVDLDASSRLAQQGYSARNRLNELQARVDAAQAALVSAKIDYERVNIRAPISGIVQDPFAKVGDMLQVGDVCANVMKPEAMKMIAQVSERYVGQISVGDEASVKVVTGQTIKGPVSYIAPSADTNTRTFRMEITLGNEDRVIRDGITAIAKIKLPAGKAHLLPASVLTLDDKGEIGVKMVSAEDKIAFTKVAIVQNTREGVWVTGLPEKAKIVTRGQEYVVDGQKVQPVLETAKAE